MNQNVAENNFKKDYFQYQFEMDCDTAYFDELRKFMDVDIDNLVEEPGNITVSNDKIRYDRLDIDPNNLVCEYDYLGTNKCARDKFNHGKYTQIIIGRFLDTAGCFYNCNEGYFIMATKPWSFFKNDIFINYVIDRPKLFINTNVSTLLNPIFPMRCIVSDKNQIPRHELEQINNSFEWYAMHSDPNDPKNIPHQTMPQHIQNEYNKYDKLNKFKTPTLPVSRVISREMCVLHHKGLYFYVVLDTNKNMYEPFILISKYQLINNLNNLTTEFLSEQSAKDYMQKIIDNLGNHRIELLYHKNTNPIIVGGNGNYKQKYLKYKKKYTDLKKIM